MDIAHSCIYSTSFFDSLSKVSKTIYWISINSAGWLDIKYHYMERDDANVGLLLLCHYVYDECVYRTDIFNRQDLHSKV